MMRCLTFLMIIMCLLFTCAWAVPMPSDPEVDTVVVKFHGKDLFEVTNISSVPAESRADALIWKFIKEKQGL